jgi:CubicO group peptidase (beta-lactamase class C family)
MAAVAAPESVGLSASGLDAALQRYADVAATKDVPGGVLVVVRHGQPCFLKAFGHAGAEGESASRPLEVDGIFRAASMTKIVTSLAAMMLYDRGLLLLDDPVSKYIPEFASMTRALGARTRDIDNGGGNKQQATAPCLTQMTVRHLMSHTSGLTYGFFAGTGACGAVDEISRSSGLRVGANSPGDAESLASHPLAFEPGSAFRYSCSTAVLGRIVSLASGVPLDTFLEEEICGPLGMVDTKFYVPLSQQHRVTHSYTRLGGDETASSLAQGWSDGPGKQLVSMPDQTVPSEPPESIAADGGLFTTASDWAKFMMMLTNRGEYEYETEEGSRRLLSTSSFDIMVAPATPDLSTAFNSHWSDPSNTAGPALCANFAGGGFAHCLCGEVVTDPELAGCGDCGVGAYGAMRCCQCAHYYRLPCLHACLPACVPWQGSAGCVEDLTLMTRTCSNSRSQTD